MSHMNDIILNTSTAAQDRFWMLIVGSYLLMTFTDSLRGNGVFVVEAHGLIMNVYHGRKTYETNPHVVTPLM